MDISKMTQEQISAMADGELADSHIDVAMAALRQTEGRAAWDDYHQIGDILRSDEMAVTLSPDFSARMAARLAAEPTIIAPFENTEKSRSSEKNSTVKSARSTSGIRRFAMPGMVAAAMAAFAIVSAPQLMVAMKDNSSNENAKTMIAVASQTMSSASAISSAAPQVIAASAVAEGDGVVLRDPNIDEYLLAHQRFSPSVYSTAQFARSATFATDSDK